jgi:hypothetical protein
MVSFEQRRDMRKRAEEHRLAAKLAAPVQAPAREPVYARAADWLSYRLISLRCHLQDLALVAAFIGRCNRGVEEAV